MLIKLLLTYLLTTYITRRELYIVLLVSELLSVEEPGEYKKESWAMDIVEKMDALPQLKEEGNQLFNEKKYDAAADKYGQALGMLEQLVLR